jgi:site-specific DNA recombinase
VHVPVEPIVSEELWRECNAILDQQRASYKKPSKTTRYLFAGFAHCICGKKMYVPAKSPKYTCPKCYNKIPIVSLDTIFHEQLKDFFFSPEEVASFLQQADEQIREKETLRAVLEGEQRALQKDMEKLYDLFLSDQIPQLQGEVDFLKIQHLTRDEIISEAQDLYTRWPDLPFEDKRRIVETITDSIVVGDDSIEVNLNYCPPPHTTPESRHKKAMNPQGFMAEISWNRAGKSAC